VPLPAVALRNVSKSYWEGDVERVVLSDFSASFAAGERVALLGKSGTGKSTLLHLISGIDLPTRGEVVALGRQLGRMSEEERTLFRRAHLGFVFQAFNLIPTLTIEENLALPLELRGERGDKARAEARALLAELGLGARGRSFPDALSGGEQQRVAVGRALIHRPALLLADEPTGNLDEETGRQVIGLMDRLSQGAQPSAGDGRSSERRTVIIVTHDRDVARWADRVLLLDKSGLLPAPREPG
jgi:putative ABC transport system ATP-binding protein